MVKTPCRFGGWKSRGHWGEPGRYQPQRMLHSQHSIGAGKERWPH